MEDKNISEQESLRIIQQMILTAKQQQKDDGRGWILWGWLLFSASVMTIANLQYHWFYNYFFWNAFGIISIVVMLFSIIRHFYSKKNERVKTYTGELFEKLNIGFFISLGFIILSMNLGVSPDNGFALLISLYGFWILIYGTALNFRPSIVAAFIVWAIGLVALFTHKFIDSPHDQFQWIMIFHAMAALCGYIIPGHIANNEFKKINRKVNPVGV